MKKQNIEDIFSSMENFSSVPPPELWDNIEEKLHQPKKKKTAVIWWSIAASLLIGLSIPSVLYFDSNPGISNPKNNTLPNNSVVIDGSNRSSQQNDTLSREKNTIKNDTKLNNETANGIVSAEEKKSTETNHNPSVSNQNSASGIVFTKKKDLNNNGNSQVLKEGQNFNSNKEKNKLLRGKNDAFVYQNTTKATLNQEDQFNNVEKGNVKQPNSAGLIFKNNFSQDEKTIAYDSKNQDVKNIFDQNTRQKSQIPSTFEDNIVISDKKNNLKSKFENTTTENKSKPDVLLTIEESAQLAELQNLEKAAAVSKNKKEEDTKVIPNADKWSLEVFAGVANSQNLSKDKTLGNSNQSKQTNSYGVKTNYKLNKRWAVSSGLKINELGQSIANVSYYSSNQIASFFPSTSDYLNQNPTVIKPTITTNSSYVFVSKNTQNALKSSNFETGNIDQSLKYIEMPLEISYAVFNKNKTSISLNTGGFVGKLISNNVALDGTSIGANLEANDFVYGSLLSSTLQYRLYKKTHIFVEPGMNYYINPLNNQTFNQFQWAFNFGLNVSF